MTTTTAEPDKLASNAADKPPLLSHAELGRRWGVTRQAVQQWAKKGMPLDSEESAMQWRVSNTRMRQGSKLTQPTVSGGAGLGLGSVAVAEQLQGSDKFVLDLRNRARTSEKVAYKLLTEEYKRIAEGVGNPAALSILRRDHTMAANSAMNCERDATKYLMQIKRLVSWDDVAAMVRKYVVPLQVGLEVMPRLLAARVMPLDPGGAQEVIEEYANRMMQQIGQVHSFIRDYEETIKAEVARIENEVAPQ